MDLFVLIITHIFQGYSTLVNFLSCLFLGANQLIQNIKFNARVLLLCVSKDVEQK